MGAKNTELCGVSGCRETYEVTLIGKKLCWKHWVKHCNKDVKKLDVAIEKNQEILNKWG